MADSTEFCPLCREAYSQHEGRCRRFALERGQLRRCLRVRSHDGPCHYRDGKRLRGPRPRLREAYT